MYKKSLRLIMKGTSLLIYSVWCSVNNNKLLTALILSLIANAILIVSYTQACVERENSSSEQAHLIMQLDSARHTNVKYYSVSLSDVDSIK